MYSENPRIDKPENRFAIAHSGHKMVVKQYFYCFCLRPKIANCTYSYTAAQTSSLYAVWNVVEMKRTVVTQGPQWTKINFHQIAKLELCSSKYFRVNHLTVPMKSTGSWGMIASLLRRSSKPIRAILTPSIVMEPLASSTSLNKARPREDFPVEAEMSIRWQRLIKKNECCGLTTWSGAAHDADGLFWLDGEGQTLQHQWQAITVAHVHVVKCDLSLLRPGEGGSVWQAFAWCFIF